MERLESFREIVGEWHDITTIQGLLGWDLETYMPHNGSAIRSKQLSTLSRVAHELLTSDKMSNLLDLLRETSNFSELSRIDQAIVRETAKEHERAKKLPVSLVQDMAETTANAHIIWVEARRTDNFKLFVPVLEKIISLNRQMADCLGYDNSPYNALLDLYEPGLTVDQIDPLFKELRRQLVPIIKAIVNSTYKPETRFLKKISSIDKQWQFSEQVIKDMGFDFSSGRLDKAPHPFCMGMGPQDVRLTTRFFKNDLLSSLFSSMHEAGHGIYEQGVNPALARTPLCDGASLGIHESQSRMWENMIGRSYSFWKHYLPKLRKIFPRHLENIKLDAFYKAINISMPSLIRVESDEVTYNLHIILRYEIEKELIEGNLQIKSIPETWNQKMQDYLGIIPANNADGCLQDVHWSHGSFGYFPTYTLGNIYAAQFFNTAKKQIPDLEQQIAKGKLFTLKNWLNKEIHYVGKIETPSEIIKRVTGEPLNSSYFIEYIKEKYNNIYSILVH